MSIEFNVANTDTVSGSSGPFTVLGDLLSLRPWALQCLSPSLDLVASTIAVGLTPWAVVAAAAAAAQLRLVEARFAVLASALVLDIVYLPLAEHCIRWFNVVREAGEHSQVGVFGKSAA